MKKVVNLCLLFFALCLVKTHAQDTIILNSKEKIEGKVMEVGLNTIKYKKASNLNGPLYSAEKNDIFLIIYENGSQESFEKPESKPLPPEVPVPSSEPAKSPSPTIPPSAPIITSTPSTQPAIIENSRPAEPLPPPIQETPEINEVPVQPPANLENMLVPTGRYKLSSLNKGKMRKNDLDIYRQYKSGRRMKTIFGSISLASTGIFVLLLVNDLAYFDVNNTYATVISPPTYIFAGAGLITSFLTKGPKKKIKRSYTDHNNDIKRQMKAQANWSIKTSGNGLGFMVSF